MSFRVRPDLPREAIQMFGRISEDKIIKFMTSREYCDLGDSEAEASFKLSIESKQIARVGSEDLYDLSENLGFLYKPFEYKEEMQTAENTPKIGKSRRLMFYTKPKLSKKDLSDQWKILIMLWRLGPNGTARLTLQKALEGDKKLFLKPQRCAVLLVLLGKKSEYVEIIPDANGDRASDIIRPLITIESFFKKNSAR